MGCREVYVFFSVFVWCSGAVIHPRIVIVGGGAAGMAALTRLSENNFDNVYVLEAKNRIGGRIHSVEFGDAYVDLGAQWCHGEKGNVVYSLVKDYDLLEHMDFRIKFYHSDGNEVDDDVNDKLLGLYENMYFNDAYVDKKEGVSVGEFFVEKYTKAVQEIFGNDSKKLQIAMDAMGTFEHIVLSVEGAFSWFDTSVQNDYEHCQGDSVLGWKKQGYRTFFDILTKNVSKIDEQIQLNKEVVKINWSDDQVLVTCSDSSEVVADHVIVTTSLGVLKHQHKSLFHPPLPEEKIHAIEELGIGAVAKIFFYYEEKWWNEDFKGLSFIWNQADKVNVQNEFPVRHQSGNHSWFADIMGFFPMNYNPNVLVCWITGATVQDVEDTSDEEIIDGSEFVLNKFIGNKFNVTKATKIARFNWYSDPHFRGTYSFQTVASRKRQISAEFQLSQPLLSKEKKVVFFAGEATHPHYYSTVHGAVESGFREAERVIKIYRSSNIDENTN